MRKSLLNPAWLSGLGILTLGTLSQSAPALPKYHLVRTIKLNDDGMWDYLMTTANPHRLYVSRSTHVDVINLDNGSFAGSITPTPGVHGIAVDEAAGKGYTSDGQDATVTVFDVTSRKVLKTIPVGQGPDAIIFDPKTERVFTFNGRDNSSTVIDCKTDKVIGTIVLPGRPEFAVTDGKGHVYDNIEDKSEIVSIDANQLIIDAQWSIFPGEGPSGLSIDSTHGRLYSVCSNQLMVISDANRHKVVDTAAIGRGPDAAAFDTDYKVALSSNGQDGTLTVVMKNANGAFVPIGEVKTMISARTLSIDPKTHHVYLFGALMEPQAPGGNEPRWNRKAIPGSFTVMDFAP